MVQLQRFRDATWWALAVALLLIPLAGSHAQSDLDNTLKQFTGNTVKGYIQPMADLFGANMHAGLYRSAHIPTTGFHIALDIVVMGATVGDDQKTYDVELPAGYSARSFKGSTIFGKGEASVYTDPNTGLEYASSGGIINTSLLPLAAPQLTIGSIYGTDAIVRFITTPSFSDDKFPKVTLWGIGARHSISQYLVEAPVDIAAGIFYSSFTVGDLIDFKGLTIGAQAGKTFAILSVFGGIAWEQSTMNLKYTSTSPLPGVNPNVNIDLDGDNSFRFTAGASLQLAIIRLFADANFGSVTNFSAGIGFGI
jgi:hypothetical protein